MKKLTVLVAALFCIGACGGNLKSAVKNGAIAPSFNDTLLDGDYFVEWVAYRKYSKRIINLDA